MPRYDMKCSWCDYETEVWKAIDDVVSCTGPSENCPGIMEVAFRTPPALTRAACPTRKGYNDGVKYRTSGPAD